jgi:predicted dehydrogenase
MALTDMNTGKFTRKNPLKVGIIGMGKMGGIRAEVVQASPLMKLKAIADVRPETLSDYDVAEFTDPYQLLEQDLDAVFVCTYNHVAPDIVVAGLNRGLHIFCEKPPGTSVADVQKMIDASNINPDCKVKFGFNHRYHYSVMEAKSMIESGRYGKIISMRGVYGKTGGIQFENNWRSDRTKAGGGILLDQGIHMLDLFRYYAGDFNEIKSMVTTSFWDIPVEDNAFAILKNPENQIAIIHSTSTQWKHKFSLEISLEDGYINLNGFLTSTRSYGDETLTFARKQFEDTTFAVGKPREEMIYFDRNDSWQLEVDEFFSAINENRPIKNGTLEDAYKIMELIEEIYKRSEEE